MSIETLQHKVMDTLTVEQLEQQLDKWQGKLRDAEASGILHHTTHCSKMVKLFEMRLSRARNANGGKQNASGTTAL